MGWKLYLPPHNFPPSTGKLGELRGVITTISYSYWDIQVDDNPGTAVNRLMNIDAGEFITKPQNSYRVGDCVTIIYDVVDQQGHPLLVIPQ